MDFQKAFKILGSLVDSSVNFHSYNEAQRDRFHCMAYWFKQVIEYSADYGTQYDYTQQCIRRFTEEVNMFNKKFDHQYPYILQMQELLDEVRIGEILTEEIKASWKPFMTHYHLGKGWVIRTSTGREETVEQYYANGKLVQLQDGTNILASTITEYRIPQVNPSVRITLI